MYHLRQKRREQWKRFNKSAKGKSVRKRYEQNPHGKSQARMDRYNRTPKSKLRLERYAKTDKSRARYIRHNKSAKGRATRKRYRIKHAAVLKAKWLAYREQNYEKFLQLAKDWQRREYENNPAFRIKKHAQGRIRVAMKDTTGSRKLPKSASKLLGCSWEEFRRHIESQFKPGMTWDNYGRGGWEVDHIKPIERFDLTDPKQLTDCFHYSNLQPLWWQENRHKSDTYVEAV